MARSMCALSLTGVDTGIVIRKTKATIKGELFMEEIIRFYDVVDEELRFQRNSRKIEYLTTLSALEEVIQNQSSIIETHID